jgi:ABC-2 type transport system permease protein
MTIAPTAHAAPAERVATAELGTVEVVTLFARLRWRLLRGAIRQGGTQRVAVTVGLVASVLVGVAGSVIVVVAARTIDDPRPGLVVFPVALVVAVVALGVITGASQPVDPRVIAAEPLPDRQLGLGLLTASAFGPPGIATTLLGIGLFVGVVDDVGAIVPGLTALAVFLATLLLVSRTTINVLGLFTSRYPRWGQVTIGLVSLAFYGLFQFAPQAFARLDPDQQRSVASIVRLSPAGQVGEAFAAAGSAPLVALGHAALGAIWLPALAWVFVVTTRRVLLSSGSSARAGASTRSESGALASGVRRACGRGAVGAIAWRSVRTRMRHPRTALETFIGAGIGLAIVLVPALTRDDPGSSAVLVGGAVQLSVLFIAGNSIGSDGPALGAEILCGLEPEVIVRAKVRSVIIVASPLAAVGPMIAAGVTGEWRYLPAGIAVGIAGLLAGAGGAIVQSTIVPIAVPESDNPLASGDSGSGLLAALVLVVVLITLAIVTLPVALALVWALTTESVVMVTALGIATTVAGWGVMRLGQRIAAQRWRRHEPEIYDAIIPAL